jgi:cytidylate kinase
LACTHVSRKVVEAFDEKAISEIEVLIRGVLGDQETASFRYAYHLAKAAASVAKLGNAVILGRGANHLVPKGLHVRIAASWEHRVANMVRFEGLTRREAEERLHRSDQERRRFLERTYGRDRVRDFQYDIEIWMDNFLPEGAADVVATAVKARCDKAKTEAASQNTQHKPVRQAI